MQYSVADTKPPILMDLEFTHPEKLQLCFWPTGKYTASTFNSHIRIPFNYSGLLNLQSKLKEHLDNFFSRLYHWNFCIAEFDKATFNSTFQLYKGNTDEIFKLFNDLLISLPHIPANNVDNGTLLLSSQLHQLSPS
jgi:hypothetical protein